MESRFTNGEIETAVASTQPNLSWKYKIENDYVEGLYLGTRPRPSRDGRTIPVSCIDAHLVVEDGIPQDPGRVDVWLSSKMLLSAFTENPPEPGVSWVRITYRGKGTSKNGRQYNIFGLNQMSAKEAERKTPLFDNYQFKSAETMVSSDSRDEFDDDVLF